MCFNSRGLFSLQVVQAFDASKFHFGKAFAKEAMFAFEPARPGSQAKFDDSAVMSSSPNVLIINISPIEYGHVLLVPRILDQLPQLVTPETLMLAMRFAIESNNPYCRVG